MNEESKKSDKYGFCLTRVRYTAKSGTVKTYRTGEVIKIGGPDDPPLGDEIYQKYFVLGGSEREVRELGVAAMQKNQ